MKNKGLNKGVARVFSVLVVILGIAHDLATFTPVIMRDIPEGRAPMVIYMSLMCGTGIVLGGLLSLLLSGQSERKVRLAYKINSIFLVLAGVGAFVAMPKAISAWFALGLCGITGLLCMMEKPMSSKE